MTLAFKTETGNKNLKPLCLGQSSTSTCCWPSWMADIMKISKKATMDVAFKRETNNKNQTPLRLDQSSTRNMSVMASMTKNHKNN